MSKKKYELRLASMLEQGWIVIKHQKICRTIKEYLAIQKAQ